MSDEESFVILGSTPTPSMEQYIGHEAPTTIESGSTIPSIMMQSKEMLKKSSLLDVNSLSLSATSVIDSINYNVSKNDSLAYSVQNGNQQVKQRMASSATSGSDFAEQFLMGEIPADSLKYSVWKQFPSLYTSQSKGEDIDKLESLIGEHNKLKENLNKTNEAMHQHFSTINKWQTVVKELKETQATEIARCNELNSNLQKLLELKVVENDALINERDAQAAEITKCKELNDGLQEQLRLKTLENENLHIALSERDDFNQNLKKEVARIREEHEEAKLQFNMNLAYAAGENKDLVQELSAKNSVIQNMTMMIEKLEKQTSTFELLSLNNNEQEDPVQSENSSITSSQAGKEFATQLGAAREQNIELLEEVSNKIATIKRLESEASKLQHQLLSLEMIVNENDQKSIEDTETVRQLKDELNQMSAQNVQLQEIVRTDYAEQIEEMKQIVTKKEEQMERAVGEIQNMIRTNETQRKSLNELQLKIDEQQEKLTELEKENATLKSKEITSDIQARQRNQEFMGIKEENEFLKAQLDVYKADFEMERQSRQDIANEREEILSDLKLLQRRNQQLIEEAQAKSRSSTVSFSSPSGPSAPANNSKQPESSWSSAGRYVCPVCNNTSPNYMALQNHVQSCLEK